MDQRERVLKRTSKTIVFIFASWIVVISGFVVTLIDSWGTIYRWNLFFHPALGILVFIPFMRHFRKKLQSHAVSLSTRTWIDLPALIVILASIVMALLPSKDYAYVLLTLLLLFILLGAAHLILRNDQGHLSLALLFYFVLGLWLLMTLTGLSILFLSQSGGIKGLFIAHRALSLLFIIPFSTAIFMPKGGPIFRPRGSSESLLNSRLALWACAGPIGLLVLVTLIDKFHRDPSFRVHLSTIPTEHRSPEERTFFFSDPSFPPAGIDLTRSCIQGPGCHHSLEKGFLNSNHNISLMTPHFQKNMALLTEEIGDENSLICAGCHFPAALFDRAKSYKHFQDHNNFSCSFCHMISDVHVNPKDNRRSAYSITPPVRHLSLFVNDGVESPPDPWVAAQIKLSPLAHGRAFMKRTYSEDPYCVVCHHHQILLNPEEGLARPKCIDCHMQPQNQIGLEGTLRNHFMPGANLAVPFFAGRQEAVEIIRHWIQGRYLLALPGWENLYKLRKDLADKPAEATWLAMVFESITKAVPGQDYVIRIITTNAGMEHPFPAAPLDLIEAWLEVRVEDEQGHTIYRSGGVGEDGCIDPDAHKIGGYMIGMDDKLVKKNRVWQIKEKVVERVIRPGHHIEDTYTFSIPKETRGFLKIEGSWNYRKLNQDFLEWAYERDTNAPIVRVGSFEGQVKVEAPLYTAQGNGYSATDTPFQ